LPLFITEALEHEQKINDMVRERIAESDLATNGKKGTAMHNIQSNYLTIEQVIRER